MLPIKEDDEFFSKVVTKESSIANPSFRVYYGEISVAVPFVWEAKPGTPKHTKHDSTFSNEEHQNKDYLPPLTPPPSYYLKQSQNLPSNDTKKFSSTKIFLGLFPKRMHRRQISSTSSSSSSTLSCPSSSIANKRRTMSRTGSLFDFIVNGQEDEDDKEEDMKSPKSVLCFGCVGSRRIRNCSVV
ncbi:Lipoyl synthase [Bienertia sinuspersici]